MNFVNVKALRVPKIPDLGPTERGRMRTVSCNLKELKDKGMVVLADEVIPTNGVCMYMYVHCMYVALLFPVRVGQQKWSLLFIYSVCPTPGFLWWARRIVVCTHSSATTDIITALPYILCLYVKDVFSSLPIAAANSRLKGRPLSWSQRTSRHNCGVPSSDVVRWFRKRS